MGDRTFCRLSVQKDDVELVKQLIDRMGDSFDELNDSCDTYAYFDFFEVNYGRFFCEEELLEAGVPCDWEWQSGSEYGPGTTTIRFDGTGEEHTNEVDDSCINPDLDQLIKLIDSPDELREHILKHKEQITHIPWDNQAEYKKLYRAKKLIT
ncbi:MAG: hypothetical protein ACRBB6_04435 [Neptuniibacter sp.]